MVVTTALQLGLVVLVWLVALVPAALAALTILIFKAVRHALGAGRGAPPHNDTH